MDKIIGYAGLVFRLAFLPLAKPVLTRKRKIALIVASNIIMMYAVFIISIPPRKSMWTKVNEAFATEQIALDNQERRIHDIVLKHAKALRPNIITIVPTTTLEAEQKRDSTRRANALSIEDERFLLGVMNGEK